MADTKQQQSDRDDLAIARLTLNISKSASTPVGPVPDEAELAALVENKLETVRRAQVISHIANNNGLYERWLQLVDALVYVGEMEAGIADEDLGESDKVSLVQKLKAFFSAKTISVFGGGIATAAITLLVILALPLNDVVNLSQGLDEAYGGWGKSLPQEWANMPESSKPKPGFSSSRKFTFKPVVKSDVRKIIESGFKDGSSTVTAYPYKSFNLNPESLASVTADKVPDMATQEFSLFYSTGRFAALTAMQCTLDPHSDRLNDLYPIASKLVTDLAKTAVPEIQPLIATFADEEQKKAVCTLSAQIMNFLTSRSAPSTKN